MKILIVEDSERLRLSLNIGLKREGYAVDLAADGEEGLEFAFAYDYDVIVLDLMMPKVTGLEVLKQLRQREHPAYVLILSARDAVDDRVQGLDLGADDYLVKPFSFDELCARLQALVRRRHQIKNPCIRLGNLSLNSAIRQVTADDKALPLTPSEYSVLEFLILRRGQVFSKDRLLEQLHDSDTEASANLIEVLVSNVRKKFRLAEVECPIKTRRRIGYLVE